MVTHDVGDDAINDLGLGSADTSSVVLGSLVILMTLKGLIS